MVHMSSRSWYLKSSKFHFSFKSFISFACAMNLSRSFFILRFSLRSLQISSSTEPTPSGISGASYSDTLQTQIIGERWCMLQIGDGHYKPKLEGPILTIFVLYVSRCTHSPDLRGLRSRMNIFVYRIKARRLQKNQNVLKQS